MTAPLIQSCQEVFNSLVLRPEIAMQQTDINNRALALLSDEFVQRRVRFKVVARIIRGHEDGPRPA